MTCTFCNGSSGAEPEYRLVTAWEKRSRSASRRGGSDLFLRQPHPDNEWACGPCIGRLRDGLSVEQGSLL